METGFNELNNFAEALPGLKYHHTALERGYVSRRSKGYVEGYKGIFGTGCKVHRPCWSTNNYHYIDYYILEDDK